MRMLKRFSLAVAIALGICLLAPTGDAKDNSVASSFPSLDVSFNQTGATGLASPTLEGRNNTLYASSHCCNEIDDSCCAPRNPPEETEDSVSLGSQCFDMSQLSTAGVASVFGDNPLHTLSHCCDENDDSCCPPNYPEDEAEDSISLEPQSFNIVELNTVGVASAYSDNSIQVSSHCCDTHNSTCCPDALPSDEGENLLPPELTTHALAAFQTDSLSPIEAMSSKEYSYCCSKENQTCCPEKTSPLLDAISANSLAWLRDSYGVPMEDLPNWSISFVSPGADVAWLDASYCCSASTGNYTCCPPVTEDVGAGRLEAREMTGESSGRLAATLSDIVQVWFDGDQRARVLCLK